MTSLNWNLNAKRLGHILVSALLLVWAAVVLLALIEWMRRDWLGLGDLQKNLVFFGAGESTTAMLRALPLNGLRGVVYMLMVLVTTLSGASAYLVIRHNNKALAMCCAIAAAGSSAWIYYAFLIDVKFFQNQIGFPKGEWLYWDLLGDFSVFAGISTAVLLAQLALRYPVQVSPGMLIPANLRIGLWLNSLGPSVPQSALELRARFSRHVLTILRTAERFLLSKWLVAAYCIVWTLGVSLTYAIAPESLRATSRDISQVVLSYLETAAYAAPLALSVYWLFFASRHLPNFDQASLRWVRACYAVATLSFLFFEFGSQLLGVLAGPAYEDIAQGIGNMLQLPVFCLLLLFSVLYRGEGDPTLKVRTVCLWSTFALAMTGLFLLLEVLLVSHVVKWLSLPALYAQLATVVIAGGLIGPFRKLINSRLQGWIATMLPAEDLAGAERRNATISFTDICGYTRLSTQNEEAALMVAGILKRLSIKVAAPHGSRLVKSIGDAVMYEHKSPLGAAKFLSELHSLFAEVAGRVMDAAPELHSGVHAGVVAVSSDKDLFGNAVNIAARIQDAAKPTQILFSAEARDALEGQVQTVSLGLLALKNIPEPLECFLLKASVK
jgi:class 3 adenylate cyclase